MIGLIKQDSVMRGAVRRKLNHVLTAKPCLTKLEANHDRHFRTERKLETKIYGNVIGDRENTLANSRLTRPQ